MISISSLLMKSMRPISQCGPFCERVRGCARKNSGRRAGVNRSKAEHPTPNTQHPTPNTQHPMNVLCRELATWDVGCWGVDVLAFSCLFRVAQALQPREQILQI